MANNKEKMREAGIQCAHPGGAHRMAYVEWGDPHNPRVLFCVHGLTRCNRDFDDLAQAMCAEYRVICPDVAGRGKSDWLPDPAMYQVPQYAADMQILIDEIAPQTLHWVGTSMGGLIGMQIAAPIGALGTPISKLVLNDVGPVIEVESLHRIGQYLGHAPRFDSLEAAELFVRKSSASFGELSDEKWRHLTAHVLRQTADGKYEFSYDPAIAEPFRQALLDSGGQDIELWPLYDQIACPTLLLRGAESDLLAASTAREMTRRGPAASLIEVPHVGHAPTLMVPEQIAHVRRFLLG